MEENSKAGYYKGMRSKNARFLRQELVEKYRNMTPAERVKAFIEHSRLMIDLRKAGELRRNAIRNKKVLDG